MTALSQAVDAMPAIADAARQIVVEHDQGHALRPIKALPPPGIAPPEVLPRRSRRQWQVGGGMLLLLAIASIAWWTTHRTAAVRYVSSPVSRGAITRVVTATGTVNPVLTIIVGSYVSGVIQELSCDYNTKVAPR